jgi:uncharacterized protein (DUF3084 family)
MKGMLERGNIDLTRQPVVRNPDGTTSTVNSTSWEIGPGRHVLVPRVLEDGRNVEAEEALEEFYRTGRHLGIFKTSEAATAFSKRLHKEYEEGNIKMRTPAMSIPGASKTGLPNVPSPPLPLGLRTMQRGRY